MKNSLNKLIFLLLTASALLINTACSSSDDGGGSSAATITDANSQALAIAGTEGVKQAVNGNSFLPFARIDNASATGDFTVALAQQISQAPSLAVESVPICDSGTAIITIDESTGSGSFVLTDCDIGGAIANGTATFTSSTAGSITTTTITFVDFTVTYDGVTETIDLTSTCTIDTSTSSASVSCTTSSTALGIDGRTYSVSDVSITGDDTSGYSVSATVTDPDHGVVTITTTIPVTFDCSTGQPNAGEIVVSDGSNTLTVTFNSCTSYTVTFNGVANIYSW